MSRLEGRRRLPDILIGLLVLGLLVGFGALLLGQRHPAPEAQTAGQPPAAVQTPPGIPAAPGSQVETVPAPPAQPATGASGAASSAPHSEGASSGTSNAAERPYDEGLPAADPAPASPAPANPSPETVPGNQGEAAAPAEIEPGTTGLAVTPAPRTGGAEPTSAERVPTRSDYRISLGGFGSTDQAVQQTAGVAALGYTVYSIDLGSQVVAQVGPFADAASAERALADIRRAYPGASLFAPRPSAEAAPSGPTQTPPAQLQPVPSGRAPAAPSQSTPKAEQGERGTAAPATPSPAAPTQAKPRQTPPKQTAQTSPAPSQAKRTPSQAAPSQSVPAQNAPNQQPQAQTERQPAPPAPAPASSAPKAERPVSTAEQNQSADRREATPPASAAAPAQAAPQRAPRVNVPSTPIYLQIGAFDDPDRAQQLVSDLQGQGFNPSVNAPEGERVRVIIGPFSGDDVTRAEARLDASGYDHFRLR